MFPSEKQREREARPTTWASKYYQVDLIFLTLVRDTAFYSQYNNHRPSPLLPAPPAPLASSKSQHILSTASCLQPWQGESREHMKLTTFFPASCRHIPATLGKWPLAWLGRGKAVGLCARHWHPRIPKSSVHQDAMTLLLAPGLVGKVFSHVIVIVQDIAWCSQVLGNKEANTALRLCQQGFGRQESSKKYKFWCRHLLWNPPWAHLSPRGKERSSCVNYGKNCRATGDPSRFS